MNPTEIYGHMVTASNELQARANEHPTLVENSVNANRAAKLAMATATLARDPKETVQVKQAHVDQATADVQATAEMAEKLLASNKLAISAAQSRLSAFQSLATAMREEAKLARIGDTA